jgi:hypothetical protein
MIAQTVEGEERARLWTRTAREYPAYADYQQKTDRKIPFVLLRSAAENDELAPLYNQRDVGVKVLSRIEV